MISSVGGEEKGKELLGRERKEWRSELLRMSRDRSRLCRGLDIRVAEGVETGCSFGCSFWSGDGSEMRSSSSRDDTDDFERVCFLFV